jgi:hypothetical protein
MAPNKTQTFCQWWVGQDNFISFIATINLTCILVTKTVYFLLFGVDEYSLRFYNI